MKIIFSNVWKLFLGFTAFDDILIVFVTLQPQKVLFLKFDKKDPQKAKILLLSLTNQFLDGGQICLHPTRTNRV